ncbi:MAG: hypothetical protein C4346_14640 [Chloroflexota bacterium]
MQIETILSQIDLGAMALPEFQRGYVWNREQVRGLMTSLYRRFPVGSLLVWVTHADITPMRGGVATAPGGLVELILDGQQRITTLYGIIRGRPPRFFDGDARAFTDLYFNLDDETFGFYAPLKMKGNPFWIPVTDVFRHGVGVFAQTLLGEERPDLKDRFSLFLQRLTTLDGIRTIDLHIEKVSGEDKTIAVVVDIFNRVNSGGTKLSQGDLALAKICASWPDARDEMKARLEKWRRAGFDFRLEWLLRCITTLATGEALFTALERVNTTTFKQAMIRAEKHIDTLLNLISARLGLDHDQVLGSRYAFPLLVRYLDQRGGSFRDSVEQSKVLYWYVHTFLWGRYTGSTETVLNQDLALIENLDGALDRLIDRLRQQRGDLNLKPDDFLGWSQGARFYPLLYMLTRAYQARDWNSGIPLSKFLLGKSAQLHVHHIFPKALLYKHGYAKAEVNALANLTFLTQETNLQVTDRDPAEYIPYFEAKHPGVMASHWIPMDPTLWRVERYREFLAARRALLAQAANEFLDSLAAGSVPAAFVAVPVMERREEAPLVVPVGGIVTDDEERLIRECNEWAAHHGLPEGEYMYEIRDPESGAPLAILDLAWPHGLQEGLSVPVALLIDEGQETEEAANRAGFRFFTSVDEFKDYVRREVLVLEPAGV